MSETFSFLRIQWERSTLRRLGRWFFSRRTLKKALFVLVCLATLVGLFYAEENWRGRRAWNHYEVELKARGEPVGGSELVPPPIPDARNFAAIPFFDRVFAERGANLGEDWEDYGKVEGRLKRVRAQPRDDLPRWKTVDLVAWDYAYRNHKLGEANENLDLPPIIDSASRSNAARAVLEWLGGFDPLMDELRQAASRPDSRYPVDYSTPNPAKILLPHLTAIKRLCQILTLHAAAELAVGNSAAAASDLALIFRLSDSLKNEPFLISQLVRIACVDIALETIWGGLSESRWSQTELALIEARLAEYDFLEELPRTFWGERAFSNSGFDFLRAQPKEAALFLDGSTDSSFGFLGILIAVAPRGWLYMEQVTYNRMFDLHVMPPETSGNPRVRPELVRARSGQMDRALKGGPVTTFFKHRYLSELLLPALEKAIARFARTQALTEMGILACALERHRLSTGKYPQALEALRPRFVKDVPTDVVVAEPYRYKLNPDGGFVLYSVGWNLADDGGAEKANNTNADWVWPY